MIEKSDLVAGARIEWTSQAGGFVAKKRGKLIAFVPRNSPLPRALLVGEHRVHGNDRSHIDRYLILLEEKSVGGAAVGKGRKKNHYYLPVASVVRAGSLIEPASPVVHPPAEGVVVEGPKTEASA